LKLTNDRAEIKPEPLSWDKFAAENGPPFVTWDAELGFYLHPLDIVTLANLNLAHRVPKVAPHASKLARVISNASGNSKASSVATTTTAASTTSSGASTLDLPGKLLKDLFTTINARSVHQDMRPTAYFSEHDRKRKTKEVAKRKDDKNENKNKNKKRALARHQTTALSTTTPTPSPSTDVIMSEVVD